MDKVKLQEIRNNLALLPMLQDKAEILRKKLKEAENSVRELLQKYEKECMDVEQLKNNTLSVTLLKLIGKYEGRLEKESQEIISAKLEYDKATERAKELHDELIETEDRIGSLKDDQRAYEAEIKKREETIKEKINGAASEEYQNLENERTALERQLVEIREAIRAGERAKSTARSVIEHLNSAESWATFDVWSDGGIISHAAKYSHIDQAESDSNRLSSQLKDFRKELSDIDIPDTPVMDGIDSTTRAVDFWLDNIFTDLNVRERIRSDLEQVRKLYGRIDRTIEKLESRKAEIHRLLEQIENRKEDLIISL